MRKETGAVGDMLRVNVRTLAEFYYEGGDLESGRAQLRRMLEGARGHRLLQSRYEEDWRSEAAVSMELDRRNRHMELHGRIDGLKKADAHAWIEEIKTTEADVSLMTGEEHPVHWAQAELYAVMVAEKDDLKSVTVRLCYYNMKGASASFAREYSREALLERLDIYLNKLLDWLDAADAWRDISHPAMQALSFPFGGYRAGQRSMAANVYTALRDGKMLICQAPTGIGKTMAALFPAFKALGEEKIERIFYLTARSTGAAAAQAAIERLRESGLRARCVALTAKETICPFEACDCRPQVCPRARGYYDRRRAALYEGLTLERLGRADISALAERHTLCPFELSLDLAENADVVIGDYNYVFDPRVKLQRFFTGKSQAALLIDEAHNLAHRSRNMLSAALDGRAIRELRRALGQEAGRSHALYKALSTLLGTLKALGEDMGECSWRSEKPEVVIDAVRALAELFDASNEAIWSAALNASLTEMLFQCLDFLRAGDMYDEHFRTLIAQRGRSDWAVTLFCADPSDHIAQTLRRVHGAALFSATMTPLEFYRDLFGLSEQESALLDLPSPFPKDNLLVMRYALPLRYRQREGSLPALAQAICAFLSAKRGSYIVCFPSYAFMEQVYRQLDWPVRVLLQSPGMDEADKRAFLDNVQSDPAETTALFIVMGGVFSEGIEWPDNRLSGAVIVGTGVPQISTETSVLRELYDNRYRRGYAYACQYPGLARVYQAAGRVIRSESDRGAVLLIDSRWADGDHRGLLPPHWLVHPVRGAEEIIETMKCFWTHTKEEKI